MFRILEVKPHSTQDQRFLACVCVIAYADER